MRTVIHDSIKQAYSVPENLVKQEGIYNYIGQLMRKGQSDQQVHTALLKQGVMPYTAQLAICQLRSQFQDVPAPKSLVYKVGSILFGSVLFCCQPWFLYLRHRRQRESSTPY